MAEIKKEDVKPGMYIRVFQKIKENDKERIQRIEGIVLARKHNNEPGATITLRRVMDGVGVEWILPLFSPLIDKIELIRNARVKRAKLYFLRNKSSKEIRKKLKVAPQEKQLLENISIKEQNTSESENKENKEEKTESLSEENSAI
ncbi:MAG: 50S ribosomal protein L19 [Minisyncoccia bacterium]|jgi:large subunit ribosomal protein L19